MPANNTRRSTRLSRDASRLVALTDSLSHSGSRLEDIYWEGLLRDQIVKLLQGRKNSTLETVLDQLATADLNAYEVLVEQAETHSESGFITVDDTDYDVLLFSAPLVAWTRYQLPGAELSAGMLDAVTQQLQQTILAPQTQLALVPQLLCFEQMPQSFHETWLWTNRLGRMALGQRTERCDIAAAPDPQGMLADARFLVGAIVTPKGMPLFRWQSDAAEPAPSREQCLKDWVDSNARTLTTLFTGCNIDYLQPDAYYVNSREADRRIRPLALKAAVTWLHTAARLPAGELRATLVGCGNGVLEEYRIGFTTQQNNEVIYGCIWPILSKEEALANALDSDQAGTADEIAALLKELGVSDIRHLPGLYGAEFCDDCGAPYFPNPLGELMHPELPEEIDLNPVHFH